MGSVGVGGGARSWPDLGRKRRSLNGGLVSGAGGRLWVRTSLGPFASLAQGHVRTAGLIWTKSPSMWCELVTLSNPMRRPLSGGVGGGGGRGGRPGRRAITATEEDVGSVGRRRRPDLALEVIARETARRGSLAGGRLWVSTSLGRFACPVPALPSPAGRFSVTSGPSMWCANSFHLLPPSSIGMVGACVSGPRIRRRPLLPSRASLGVSIARAAGRRPPLHVLYESMEPRSSQ